MIMPTIIRTADTSVSVLYMYNRIKANFEMGKNSFLLYTNQFILVVCRCLSDPFAANLLEVRGLLRSVKKLTMMHAIELHKK